MKLLQSFVRGVAANDVEQVVEDRFHSRQVSMELGHRHVQRRVQNDDLERNIFADDVILGPMLQN